MRSSAVAAIAALVGVTGTLTIATILDEVGAEPTSVVMASPSSSPRRIIAPPTPDVPTTTRHDVSMRRTTATPRRTTGKVVRAGAFCSRADAGAVARTVDGVPMVCSTSRDDARRRWRAVAAPTTRAPATRESTTPPASEPAPTSSEAPTTPPPPPSPTTEPTPEPTKPPASTAPGASTTPAATGS